MSNSHAPAVPVALEQVLAGLEELAVVLGEAARRRLPAVRERLTEAMAARDRGDPVASLAAIGGAMDELAAMAGELDPQEAALMRMLAERFRHSLLRGDAARARHEMDVMFERSGARERKKS